jgi:hypothetical protein
VDVEVSQVGNRVTWRLNDTLIFQRTNTGSFNAGNIMLGYMDTYNSIGAPENYVVFDNVRVVQLSAPPAPPSFQAVQVVGDNVQLDFSGDAGDAPTAFTLESSATVHEGYAPDNAATIQQLGPGSFRAVTAVDGPNRFYRVKR